MKVSETLPPALIAAARERVGTGVGQSLLGLILCLLSSMPLANLSRKAASLFAVLLTGLIAFMQRVLRARNGEITEQYECLTVKDAEGNRHEVCCRHTPPLSLSNLPQR